MADLIKETQKWDDKTGELFTQYESQKIRRSDEPNFVKLYIKAYCTFKEIKGINTNVFFELVQSMQYMTKKNIVALTPVIREEIIENLGWKKSPASKKRLSTEITKLIKAGAVSKIGYSTYQISPEIIGCGTWADVKQLRAEFNVEDGSVSIK